MGHVYYKIWIHTIWSTKNRYPLLTPDIRKKVFEHILEKAKEKEYYIEAINGHIEHSHVLFSLNPKYAISEAVNSFKGESSHWINSEKLTNTHFAWQNGYAAFSVSESQIDKVKKYIQNQEQHHKKKTFIDELKKLLELHNVVFDEKYLL